MTNVFLTYNLPYTVCEVSIDDFEFLFSTRLMKNVELKRKIAEKAASFVEPGDVIAIDTGTTAST